MIVLLSMDVCVRVPIGKHFRGDYRIVIGEEDPPDLLMVQSVENVMDGVRGRLAVENLCGLFAFVFK